MQKMAFKSLAMLALGSGLAMFAVHDAQAQKAKAQAAKFDGKWSVEVLTDKGDCDKAYRYPVVIENNKVRYGGDADFQVTGSVAQNGAINGAISRGEDQAKVTGRLSGSSGNGTWTATGEMSGCSGRWNADKRG